MWMSDKLHFQQRLSGELAELILLFSSNSLSLLFIQCFWKTLGREWKGIDYLRYRFQAIIQFCVRLDKFYYLALKMMEVSLEWLKTEEWDQQCVETYCQVATDDILR
jgi:ribosomal RNA-processing protein 1